MAIYCGLYERDSKLGDTRTEVLGDYRREFERIEYDIQDNTVVRFGSCEGHDAALLIHRDNDGNDFLIHLPMPGHRRRVPGPVPIPPPCEGDDEEDLESNQ